MDYKEALSYITGALKFGINPGLEKIEAVCRILGNPQTSYPAIQITGTNGKTSTSWMTRDILQAAGLTVGCYTSPHLHTYRERITINGELIKPPEFASILNKIMPALEQVKHQQGELTEFEILTAMAFQYFKDSNVDVTIFEVGLGGRWDATSMVEPTVAVITGISLDHTDRLGESITDIAWDKAHIIKRRSRAVVGEVSDEAFSIIEMRCKTVNAPMKVHGKDFAAHNINVIKNHGSRFIIDGIYGLHDNVVLPIFGKFQVYNFTVATAVAEIYLGRPLTPSLISDALDLVTCPGRFELVHRSPLIVLDGAHNPEGIENLLDGLPESFAYRNLIIVLAASSDKDIESMIEMLTYEAHSLILSQNESTRSATAEQLGEVALKSGNSYIIEPDLRHAISRALSEASQDDLVCITGSLYTVADARRMILNLPSDG